MAPAAPRWTRKRLEAMLGTCYGRTPVGHVDTAAVAHAAGVSVRTATPGGDSVGPTDFAAAGDTQDAIAAPVEGDTVTLTVSVVDLAGNTASDSFEVTYITPPVEAVIASNNTVTSLAKEDDVVTITVTTPSALDDDGGDPAKPLITADFFTSVEGVDTPLASDVQGVEAGPNTYEISYTVQAGDAELPVGFLVSYTLDGVPGTLGTTVDGSSVTIDLTPPTAEVSFPQQLADGNVGIAEGGDVEIEILVDERINETASEGVVFTLDGVVGEAVSFADAQEVDDGFLYTFLVSGADDGDLISHNIGELFDLAGNMADPDASADFTVVVVTELVSATIERAAEDVDGVTTYIGKGAAGSATYQVTVSHEVVDRDDHEDVSVVGIEFIHAVGDAFTIGAVTTEDPSDFPLVLESSGGVDAIEIELSEPLEGLDEVATYTFSFTVVNKEDGGAQDTGLATDDPIGIQTFAYNDVFVSMTGDFAATDLVADVDGPTIGGHAYPIKETRIADDVIDYLEFTQNGPIEAELDTIVDVGPVGATSVEVGYYSEDEMFEQLGSGELDGDAINITLDSNALARGDITLVARATDALGNIGAESEFNLTIAIVQYIVVSAAEDFAWVGPAATNVGFTIDPVDVVEGLKRYELRVFDGAYALGGFDDASVEDEIVGKSPGGGVVLIRYVGPDNAAALVADADLAGLPNGAHLTQSDFRLDVRNAAGSSGSLQIVNETFQPFTTPVFRAVLDVQAPLLTFDGFTEAATNGQYQTNDPLTFEYTTSDGDSGLAANPIALEQLVDDEWVAYDGETVDLEAGTVNITLTPGRHTYRLTSTDNVGNVATTDVIEVDVLGEAIATIDSLVVLAVGEEGPEVVTPADGIHYFDLDRNLPGDPSDGDASTINATILLDENPREGLEVVFDLVDVEGASFAATTDADGVASWSFDPDTYDLDLQTVNFTVTVPAQTVESEDGDVAFEEVSSNGGALLWTGFYAVPVHDSGYANVGDAFDVSVDLYWLHEFFADGEDPAVPVADFDGSIDLIESIGDQDGLIAEDIDAIEDSSSVVFEDLVRGTAPELSPVEGQDAGAGVRNYTVAVAGPFPNGLDGVVLSEYQHVLVSGFRLLIDSADHFGLTGAEGTLTVSGEWLHSQNLDGTQADTQEPIVMLDTQGGLFALNDGIPEAIWDPESGPIDFVYDLPNGEDEIEIAGTNGTGVAVFGAHTTVRGFSAVFTNAVLDDQSLTPGDNYTDTFAFQVDGGLVGDDFGGLAFDAIIEQAGLVDQMVAHDAAPLAGQTPFVILLHDEPVAATIEFDGGFWVVTVKNADLGVYELAIDLTVFELDGVPFNVELTDAFSVKHQLYQIVPGTTEKWIDANENETVDDGELFGINEVNHASQSYWIQHVPEEVSTVLQNYTVFTVDWDGQTATTPMPVAEELSICTVIGAAAPEFAMTNETGSNQISVGMPGSVGVIPVHLRVDSNDDEICDDEGTVPFDAVFYFTGLEVNLVQNGEQLVLVDEPIQLVGSADYDHGAPVEAGSIVTLSGEGLAPTEVTVDETGAFSLEIIRSEPGAITGITATLGSLHGLDESVDAYDDSLRWVEIVFDEFIVEESEDGAEWEEVVADGESYAVTTGNFVRIRTTTGLDDGTDVAAVDDGLVLFNDNAVDISGDGEAQRSFWSGSSKSLGVNIHIEDAAFEGVIYGDLPDAAAVTIIWS